MDADRIQRLKDGTALAVATLFPMAAMAYLSSRRGFGRRGRIYKRMVNHVTHASRHRAIVLDCRYQAVMAQEDARLRELEASHAR